MSESKVTFSDDVRQSNPTVLIYEDVCLKRLDVELLTGPFWLNDQIIAFYFQFLEKERFAEQSRFLFVSPQFTQLLKLSHPDDCHELFKPLRPDRRRLILFPVNDNDSPAAGGTHWSLLVYSSNEGNFFYFDSLNDLNLKPTKKLVRNLRIGLRRPLAELHKHDCTQQTNVVDCGLHVLENAEIVCDHFLSTGSVAYCPIIDKVTDKRKEILRLVARKIGESQSSLSFEVNKLKMLGDEIALQLLITKRIQEPTLWEVQFGTSVEKENIQESFASPPAWLLNAQSHPGLPEHYITQWTLHNSSTDESFPVLPFRINREVARKLLIIPMTSRLPNIKELINGTITVAGSTFPDLKHNTRSEHNIEIFLSLHDKLLPCCYCLPSEIITKSPNTPNGRVRCYFVPNNCSRKEITFVASNEQQLLTGVSYQLKWFPGSTPYSAMNKDL